MAKKTNATVRFFSAEEKAILNQWTSLPKGSKLPVNDVTAFCKKYDRKISAVYQYVQRYRDGLIVGKQSAAQKPVVQKSAIVKPTQDLSTLRRNEFVIPVTNWELRSENGQTNLILKFK